MGQRILLIFAYHFPPDNSAGGARPYRFFRYLPQFGYRPFVITAAGQGTMKNDGVVHVADPSYAGQRAGLSWQVERALRKAAVPGAEGLRWSLAAVDAAEKLLDNYPGAEVTAIATFPPLGTLLAGRLLRARRGVRWIADFRDPLADTPGLDALFNGRQRRIARWLEKKTMESADHVVANTDASGQELCRKHPHCGGKVTVIWNGFDPQMRLAPLALPDRPFKLVSHVGDLYLGRNVTPLLEAIGRLIDRGRLSASGIRVRLVGFAGHGSLPQPEFLERASAAGWLDLRAARVPREEAEQTSLTSDGLLLVQPHSAIQVPGKLFEYLQIGRPILAYILPASPAERILEGGGVRYTAIYPGSSQATVEDRVEEFFKQPFETVAPSAWFEEQFNAERQTAALDRLIRTIHSR